LFFSEQKAKEEEKGLFRSFFLVHHLIFMWKSMLALSHTHTHSLSLFSSWAIKVLKDTRAPAKHWFEKKKKKNQVAQRSSDDKSDLPTKFKRLVSSSYK